MKPRKAPHLGHIRAIALAGLPLAILPAAQAGAQTRASVDVSVGATAATDPFLVDGPDSGAIGANLTIDPSIFVEGDATTQVRL